MTDIMSNYDITPEDEQSLIDNVYDVYRYFNQDDIAKGYLTSDVGTKDEVKAFPKTQKCKYCKRQATSRIIHAEGMAYVPACDVHVDTAKEAVGGDNEVSAVLAVKAARAAPGESVASPDPGATRLREYWVHGEGAAKIKWDVDGDYMRCVHELEKYVGVRAKGLCNVFHRVATGFAPGQEHGGKPGKSLERALELQTKAGTFNPALHPRAPAGTTTGGKFTAANNNGSAGSQQQQTGNLLKDNGYWRDGMTYQQALARAKANLGTSSDAATLAALQKEAQTLKVPTGKKKKLVRKKIVRKVGAKKRVGSKKTRGTARTRAAAISARVKGRGKSKVRGSSRAKMLANTISANASTFFGSGNIMPGAKSSAVANIQKALGIKADGINGPKTIAAVKAYQKAHPPLRVDGIVGVHTRAALMTQFKPAHVKAAHTKHVKKVRHIRATRHVRKARQTRQRRKKHH